MYRKVPPLRALRAFEASARHLSFTKASEELYVTQAAVSLQVKQLEELLGVSLFHRGGRSLELTDDGQAYINDVRDALEVLAAATQRVTKRNRPDVLSVSVLPSFASKWLVPRLRDFHKRHPTVDVRISAFEWLVDFEKDNVDIAIRYGNGNWAGHQTTLLLKEDVFPVCSPELASGNQPIREPEDLARHTLLHDNFSREDWKMWLLSAGIDHIDPDKGISFSHTSLMLEAAVNGVGVALGRTPLVQSDLDSGRLVRPFDISLPSEFAYYIVRPGQASENPAVTAFAQWLLDQATVEQ